MRVKVQPSVTAFGGVRYGIYIKRRWLPIWVNHGYWYSEEFALAKARAIKNLKATEIE